LRHADISIYATLMLIIAIIDYYRHCRFFISLIIAAAALRHFSFIALISLRRFSPFPLCR